MTDYTQIIYDVTDRVATIRFNRPDRLNAYTGTMADELRADQNTALPSLRTRYDQLHRTVRFQYL